MTATASAITTAKPPGLLLRSLRLLAVVGAATCVGLALHTYRSNPASVNRWLYMGTGLALACVAFFRQSVDGIVNLLPGERPSPMRRTLGIIASLVGAGVLTWSSYALYSAWEANFDRAWIGFAAGSILLAIGMDLAWARWTRRPAMDRKGVALECVVVGILTAVSILYRFGNLTEFPGETGITQVEDFQHGMFGDHFLRGGRLRWEYLGNVWLAAIGIWLLGPSLYATRAVLAAVSVIRTVPFYLWMRSSVGRWPAVFATVLITTSAWDVILSRLPNNFNTLPVAITFALLAGPARRGRPSAYVLLGTMSGYILYEYIAYRPMALFALLGAVMVSFSDRNAGWPARVFRPLITIAVMIAMVIPLFLGKVYGPRFNHEYLNGVQRAQQIQPILGQDESWIDSLRKRTDRTEKAFGLFFFGGDSSPVRNIEGRPLLDPGSAVLLVLGVAYGIANFYRRLFGLTAFALFVTVFGALVATGTLEVGRGGGLVPYVYALCGIGAAAVLHVAHAALGRVGSTLFGLLIATAVVAGSVENTQFLFRFWDARSVREAMHNNLAYLTVWLKNEVPPGDQAIGIAPGQFNVLMSHDASWMRDREIPGMVSWDVDGALKYWIAHPQPTTFFIFGAQATRSTSDFIAWLLQERGLVQLPDPLKVNADLAWRRFDSPPAQLASRMESLSCRGIRGKFEPVPAGIPAGTVQSFVLPFIDYTTWPEPIRSVVYRTQLSKIKVRVSGWFEITNPGSYLFQVQSQAGRMNLKIDDRITPPSTILELNLPAGKHFLQTEGEFEPCSVEAVLRILWKGPDSKGQEEIVPFYRIGIPDESCPWPPPSMEAGVPGRVDIKPDPAGS